MLNSDPSPAKSSVCVILGKYPQGLSRGLLFQSPFEEWGRQEAARWAAGLGPPRSPARLSHSEMLLDLTGNHCCGAIKRTWGEGAGCQQELFLSLALVCGPQMLHFHAVVKDQAVETYVAIDGPPTPHPRGRVEHGEGSWDMAALSVPSLRTGVAAPSPELPSILREPIRVSAMLEKASRVPGCTERAGDTTLRPAGEP